MTRKILPAAVLAMALFACQPGEAQTRIASWNVLHLGTNQSKDYAVLAHVARDFDLIALQEVMSVEGLERFVIELTHATGAEWEATWSHLIGRGSYREKYAFIWRPDRIDYLGGDVVYLDDADVFAREPFSAAFQTHDGFSFIYGNIHAIYGDSVGQRQAEARALRSYMEWLQESFPQTPVFIAGDFNLPPSNPAWADMFQIAYPLIQEGATTISTRDGHFANLYDNIFVEIDRPLPITGHGRVEFPHEILGITHEEARRTVSDHIPVYMDIDTSSDWVLFERMPLGDPNLPDVIGNKNSGIYHLVHCPGYHATSPQNRIDFETEQDALDAGFRRAGNCS